MWLVTFRCFRFHGWVCAMDFEVIDVCFSYFGIFVVSGLVHCAYLIVLVFLIICLCVNCEISRCDYTFWIQFCLLLGVCRECRGRSYCWCRGWSRSLSNWYDKNSIASRFCYSDYIGPSICFSTCVLELDCSLDNVCGSCLGSSWWGWNNLEGSLLGNGWKSCWCYTVS